MASSNAKWGYLQITWEGTWATEKERAGRNESSRVCGTRANRWCWANGPSK